MRSNSLRFPSGKLVFLLQRGRRTQARAPFRIAFSFGKTSLPEEYALQRIIRRADLGHLRRVRPIRASMQSKSCVPRSIYRSLYSRATPRSLYPSFSLGFCKHRRAKNSLNANPADTPRARQGTSYDYAKTCIFRHLGQRIPQG